MLQSFRTLRETLSRKRLVPKTLLARLALLLLVIWGFLAGLQKAFPSLAPGSIAFSAWFVKFLLTATLIILAYRWLTRKFMWRLRNRLIVTYIFIGVIPLVLLGTMALLGAYLFAGQFSSFVVTSDLQSELKRLSDLNTNITSEVLPIVRRTGAPPKSADSMVTLTSSEFANRDVVVFLHGKPYVLQHGSKQDVRMTPPPTNSESAIVLDGDALYLRAVSRVPIAPKDVMTVVSSVPLDTERASRIASDMGVIALYCRSQSTAKNFVESPGHIKIGDTYLDPTPKVSAGTLPPPKSRWDVEFLPPGALISASDWNSATTTQIFMTLRTRPSLLYARLFRTLGEMTSVIVGALIAVGVFFTLIELGALIVGVRLTRTMTKSVASLYDATQRVNQGDLAHRINVKSRDQLAALETSFNSMTESLEKLIAEQKEKQRIESELAIAKEVQALLFPRDITELETLEVHGICRPARTVSGDYYDFLPVGPTRLGIAVGDISGKGISAALLMATVHAFVRAYTLVEQVPELLSTTPAGRSIALASVALRDGTLPPGLLLSMLNQQLYRSTPTEKYATMFLGFYDQSTREFTYSNAGHLPPMLVGSDGHVRELETGGTVVGLFGDMTYPDCCAQMNPGDIFVAYSDGVTEPENEFGEFGAERLVELVRENRDLSLSRISDIIIAAVTDWIGGDEQPDDITVVLARAR